MAINRNGQATKYKFLHNGRMLKKGFHNSTTLIWSAGSTVTYKVDTGVEYTEEVDSGATCLAPKTFAPTKDDWTFVGWREDSTANGDVLTNKVMDSEPITLYAVFSQTVTTNWISGEAGATKKTVTGTNYYNNGNIGYATLDVPAHADYSGWTWRGWSYNGKTEANASVDPNKDAETLTSVDGIRTYYGLYQKTVTQTFISHNKTEKVTGTAYYNASGNVQNASITYPSGAAYSGWSWRGWSAHNATAADAAVEFGAGQVLKTLSDYTVYGLYQQSVTLTYYDNSSTAATKSGTRYYNAAGNNKNPSFTMTQTINALFSRRGWATSNAADASIVYANGATIELTNNLTIYGCYSTEITLTYYDNSSTKQTKSGTRYYNSAGNYKNPSFTLTQVAISGWTARGWSTGTAGNSSISYNNNTAFTRDSNVTLYGCYSKSVTLSYNGNGATSGSTSSQSGTAYRNYAGTIIGASFTLRDNGFSRTNHAFTGWNLGAVGAQVTLNENTTAYAQWRLVSLVLFDNGTLRSGDSFAEYEVWSNDSSDDTALREASCGNTLYAYGRTANYDRYSVAYGMFNKAIDLSGFTKLRVTIQSASIVSSNNSRWFAGLRNNIYAGGSQWADLPWLDNCVVLSEATGGTFDVDLTAYKNAYGNTAYFLFGAGKINGNHPNGGAWVHISKVWLE